MLNKYRLFQRANGFFYWQDNESGKQGQPPYERPQSGGKAVARATLYKKSKRETLTEDEKQSLKQAAHTIKARFKLG